MDKLAISLSLITRSTYKILRLSQHLRNVDIIRMDQPFVMHIREILNTLTIYPQPSLFMHKALPAISNLNSADVSKQWNSRKEHSRISSGLSLERSMLYSQEAGRMWQIMISAPKK